MNATKYKELYRPAKIEQGRIYQDFVIDAFLTILKLPICQFSSSLYQNHVGESVCGVEIKFDDRFAETGNLYIETAEKAYPRDGAYVPSGIYRSDNSWLYVIGNFDTIFIFAKNLLQGMQQRGKYRAVQTPTSQAFLLPGVDAYKYASKVLTPNASSKIAKGVANLRDLSSSLFRSMIEEDGRQLLLTFQGEENG